MDVTNDKNILRSAGTKIQKTSQIRLELIALWRYIIYPMWL
jgi:hypothetical protein